MPRLPWGRRCQTTRILMHTNTLELGRLAVDQQAAVGIELKLADAKCRDGFVERAAVKLQRAAQTVKLWRTVRPEAGLGHRETLRGALAGPHVAQREF